MAKRARRWQDLLGESFPAKGEGQFPIAAYSEYMPAPRIGRKPYGSWTLAALSEANQTAAARESSSLVC